MQNFQAKHESYANWGLLFLWIKEHVDIERRNYKKNLEKTSKKVENEGTEGNV